jgi:adenylate cyclase
VKKRPGHVTRRAIDLALEAVPGSVVERVTSVGAPLTRYSGRTRAGAAALSSALEVLSQPPRRRRREPAAMSLDELAARAGRSNQEIERWAAAGLLDGPLPDGTWDGATAERAQLIAFALRRGTSEEEVMQAARDGRLSLLVVERSIAGHPTLTARQVADRAGVPLETALGVWRALGMAVEDVDELAFSRQELWALRVVGALRSVYTDSDVFEGASVIGRALAEVSAASIELFRRRLTAAFLEAGVDDLEISLRLAAAADLLVPTFGPVLEVVLRRHLAAATGAEAVLRLEEPGGVGGDQELSIAFADLVGFTSISERLSALEVAGLAIRLLRAAEETAGGRGARIVKSIGDAVMLSARDPQTACITALDLVDTVSRDPEMPPARAGVAHGPVLRAYADYFGRTVNIAARLCDAAGAGEVLLHAPELTRDNPSWHEMGLEINDSDTVRLKGIDARVPVFRITRER